MPLRNLVAVLVLGLATSVAGAAEYPVRTARIVVPYVPGGSTDILARLLAQKLTDALGQQFIVDNRPGAGGNIGAAIVAKSSPDGHSLLMATNGTHAINPSLYKSMPFDAVKDFAPVILVAQVPLLLVTNPHLFRQIEYDTLNDLAPISLLVRGPLVLVVHPRLPVKDTRDFLRLARSQPGAINCATVGPGSPSRLLVELLRLPAGVELTQVPYKGAAPALTDLVGGHVEAMFATVPSINAHWKAGRLRALAVTAEKGSAALPGVPAMSAVVPGFVAESWVAAFAPAKTPAEIVAKLNGEIVKALNQSDVRERFAEQGLDTVGSTAAELDARVRAELERWGKVIRARNITVQ